MRSLLAGCVAAVLACAPAQADPALWEVKGPNSTVYLFGTIHALPRGTVWESKQVSAALAGSRELYLEVANPDPAAIMQAMMQLGIDLKHSLNDSVIPADRPKFAKIAASTGLPPAALDHMRPWMAALLIQELPAVKAGFDPASGVEATLTRDAERSGIAVKSLETAEEQLHLFADLPDDAAAALLHDGIEDNDSVKGKAKLLKLLAAWKAGDLPALAATDAELKTLSATLYDRLLVARNHRWAAQIAAMLSDGGGNRFVAVGAGHLAGPDSVVALLRQQGVEVAQVNIAPR